MLLTLKDLLAKAQQEKIAFASFNAPNFETALAIVRTGEKLGIPVILSHGPGHDCFIEMADITKVYLALAKDAKVDVCIHLDHCSDIDYIKRALDLGFTSVMYDGSHEDLATNTAKTKEVVALAKTYGASVEAELGKLATSSIGQPEGTATDEYEYTDPVEAEIFVKETGVDVLAVAVGTIHGYYKEEPVLQLALIKDIKEKTGIPLALHGGSGVSDEDIRIAIANGINKINYYTYLALAGGEAAKAYCCETEKVFWHDVVSVAYRALQEDIERTMRLFSGH